MKSKFFWLVLALCIIAFIFSFVSRNPNDAENFKPLELNVGDVFSYVDYGANMYVLNYAMDDVNGDGNKDMIIAIGEKAYPEDTVAQNMQIVLYNPATETFYATKLKKFSGEMPRIMIYELNGNGNKEIVLAANDEKGNITMRIVTLQDEKLEEIFKARDNKGIIFTGNFIDGFKVYLKCSKYKKEVNLELTDRKENYVTNGFFDESGRILKDDAKITISGFTSVDFVQLDGFYGIQTKQRIIGFNNDDLLDEIIVIWKYENGKWCVKEAKGSKVGNLLY